MTRKLLTLILCVLITFSFYSCQKPKESPACRIVEEESFLGDVWREGNNLYYSAFIVVENTTDSDMTVSFIGDFFEEYRIKEDSLIAENADGAKEFKILANRTACFDNLIFTGTVCVDDLTTLKDDRELFPINVDIKTVN